MNSNSICHKYCDLQSLSVGELHSGFQWLVQPVILPFICISYLKADDIYILGAICWLEKMFFFGKFDVFVLILIWSENNKIIGQRQTNIFNR